MYLTLIDNKAKWAFSVALKIKIYYLSKRQSVENKGNKSLYKDRSQIKVWIK